MFSATIACKIHQLLFVFSLLFFICVFYDFIFLIYLSLLSLTSGFANQRAQGIFKIDWKEFVNIYQSSE